MNFDEKKDNEINNKKKEEGSINDKTGVFSMPFMKMLKI